MKTMSKFSASALRILGAAILVGGIAGAQTRGGTLTVGLSYDLDTLDPYKSGFLTDVQSTFLEGLVAPDENAEYVPALAQQVPTVANRGIRITDGGKKMVVTYKLRPNLKWADGTPLTSADVKFTWQAVTDPKYTGLEKEGSDEVEKIETPDAQTVVVYYSGILPGFKATLFTYGILPKHVLEGKDLNKDPFWDKPFGAGPFRVTEFRRGQYVIVERNPNYWRKDAAGTTLPYLDRIIFKIIPNTNTLITQIRSGEVQFAYNIAYNLAQSVDNIPGITVLRAKTLAFRHITFNHKNEFIKDLNVRKAIAHAVDRSAINRALGNYMTPTNTFVVSAFPFKSTAVPAYNFNVETAKRLLRQAGFTPGADGILQKGGKRLTLKFITQAGRTEYETAQQVVANQLKAVGIETTISNSAGAAYSTARREGQYDLWYSGWITPADPIGSYISFYGSKGFNNGSGYASAATDAALAKANSSLDATVVKANMAAAQRQVLN
ncbi:MAG TPA: peptide ABC transporter substrate-binding protein, partial [Deinococcales bacterium]|nr:peptide ABC transporter substrate-binding protein [Deinococcales bacterium]